MLFRLRNKENKRQLPKSAEKKHEKINNEEYKQTLQRLSTSRQNSWDQQFHYANQTLNEYKEKLEITYEVNSLIKKQMESLRNELQQAKEETSQYKQLWENAKSLEQNNSCNGNHTQYERTLLDQSLRIEELEKTNQSMNENLDLAIQKIERLTEQKEELKTMLKDTQDQLHDSLLKQNHSKNNSQGLQQSLKIPRKPYLDLSSSNSVATIENKDAEKIKITYKRIMKLLQSRQQNDIVNKIEVNNSEDFLKLIIQIELHLESEYSKQEYKTFRTKK